MKAFYRKLLPLISGGPHVNSRDDPDLRPFLEGFPLHLKRGGWFGCEIIQEAGQTK